MLGKILVIAVVIGLIVWGIYLIGVAVFNHFLNMRIKQTRELKSEIERLEEILEREKNEA